MINRKKISGDILLNIVSVALSTFCIQVIVYPIIAKNLTIEQYGKFLIIMAIANIMADCFGTAANNSRLIGSVNNNSDFCGDFCIFLFCSTIFCGIGVAIAGSYLFDINFLVVSLSVLYVVLFICYNYTTVYFRISLDFLKNFKCTMLMILGYFLGLPFVFYQELYMMPFIVGTFFAMFYIKLNYDIKFSLVKSSKFVENRKNFIVLSISLFVSGAALYFDRFYIEHYFDVEAVALFTVASVTAKSLSVIINPMSTVILSYLMHKQKMIRKIEFRKYILLLTLSFPICYVFAVGVAPYIIKILYPSYYFKVSDIIGFATLPALTWSAGNVLQPIILRYCNLNVQILKEVIYIFVAMIASALFVPKFGLYGFCSALTLSGLLRFLFLCFVGELKFE